MKIGLFRIASVFIALAVVLATVPLPKPLSALNHSEAVSVVNDSPSLTVFPPDNRLVDLPPTAPALHSPPAMVIENVGQFADGARFQVRGNDHTIWLAEDAIWFTVLDHPQAAPSQPMATPTPAPSGQPYKDAPRKGVNVKLSFIGANLHPRLEPFNRLDTHISYFIGSDPTKWHTDVPVWGGVRYRDLYPGIDLEMTAENAQWQLVAREEKNLSAVRMQIEGAEKISVDGSGYLHLETLAGQVMIPTMVVANAQILAQPTIEG